MFISVDSHGSEEDLGTYCTAEDPCLTQKSKLDKAFFRYKLLHAHHFSRGMHEGLHTPSPHLQSPANQ